MITPIESFHVGRPVKFWPRLKHAEPQLPSPLEVSHHNGSFLIPHDLHLVDDPWKHLQ